MEPDEVVEPEVIVRSVRRRRTQPPPPETPSPVAARTWLIYTVLAAGTAALMFDGYLSDRPDKAPLPMRSEATEVRSEISMSADSLQVVVGWDLSLSDSAGVPDSVRVRVIPQPGDTVVLSQASDQLADTAYLAAPDTGKAVQGLSCVAAQHAEPLEEVCTPWQYVRPSATVMAAVGGGKIVIHPSGLQVDPDVEGKCAEWQRTHSADSLWIEVNRTAVPECTGPNLKPTVAQFCAFAVLPDGRRVKTSNSINNPYCDELFVEWIRERYS
ncbi:MAG: hypothetical protein ABI703_05480 [Gemmatimonadales bacterium]